MNSNNKINFLKKFKELIEHLTNSTIHITQDEKNSIDDTKSTLNSHTANKSNPHEVKTSQLQDVQITSLLDNQVLVWDDMQQKYVNKFVDNIAGSDELVKMSSTSTDSKYLEDLIDNNTIVNDSDKLVVKKIENMLATVDELNYLQGLDDNIMTKLSSLNGSVDVYTNSSFDTYVDLMSFDFTTLPATKKWLMYVVSDETRNNQISMYVCSSTTDSSNPPIYIGSNSATPRNFTTNPINLTSEITGVLPKTNVDLTGLLTETEIDSYMKIEDYTGSGTNEINIAKTLSGLNHTIPELNDSITNSHIHDNLNYVDKISEDASGNLIYNGKTYSPITLEYDSTNKTLNIVTS